MPGPVYVAGKTPLSSQIVAAGGVLYAPPLPNLPSAYSRLVSQPQPASGYTTPTIRSITTGTDDGTNATVSVVTPSDGTAAQVGDAVVVIHGNDYRDLANMPTPTVSPGSPTLTSIVNVDAGSLTAHAKSYRYIVTAGNAGAQTISVTETGVHDEEKAITAIVYDGTTVDTSSLIDGTNSSFDASGSTNVETVNGITSAVPNTQMLIYSNSGAGSSSASYTVSGGSLTERSEIHVAFLSGIIATELLPTPTTVATRTITGTSNHQWGSIAIGIKAVAIAGTETVTVNPGSIDSNEAFGATGITETVSPGSIESDEEVRAPSLTESVSPGSMKDDSAVGSPSAGFALSPGSIQSGEALGTTSITETVSPGSISSEEKVRSPTVLAVVSPGSMAETGVVGSPTVLQALAVSPGSVSSGEAVGSPTATLIVSPGSIQTGEKFGTTSVTETVSPGSIKDDSGVGSPTIIQATTTAPGSIARSDGVGSPSLTVQVPTYGIESSERVGSPTITLTVFPGGIQTGEAVGSPTIVSGLVVNPGSIQSGERVGSPVVSANVTVSPGSIPTGERWGNPTVTQSLFPGSILREDGVGSPNISIQTEIFLRPGSMQSSYGMGSAFLEPPGRTVTQQGELDRNRITVPLYRRSADGRLFRISVKAKLK